MDHRTVADLADLHMLIESRFLAAVAANSPTRACWLAFLEGAYRGMEILADRVAVPPPARESETESGKPD